jgi:threonine synthase
LKETSDEMKVQCSECGTTAVLAPEHWRCSCGGAWEPIQQTWFDPDRICSGDNTVWRYTEFYNLGFSEPVVRMGTGWTPLLSMEYGGRQIHVKLEYVSPTGSFKDRGTEVMINILKIQGAVRLADDSSGNAGASVAAFAARAGIEAEIFVPAYASDAKKAQIGVYGAKVHEIPGSRDKAKSAAVDRVAAGVTYASHAYHPGFLLGQQSLAWELWEQLARRAPDWYVVPIGQGVHLLGVWLGFKRLQRAGLVERIPRLIGVQPALLAPVCQALEQGLESIPETIPSGSSIAEGLAISKPVRGSRLLQAIRDTRGSCITVTEAAILEAQQRLARSGFYIEPTSAAAFAALPTVLQWSSLNDLVIVPMTGSGLKGSPRLG